MYVKHPSVPEESLPKGAWGFCSQCGIQHSLSRTPEAEAEAIKLLEYVQGQGLLEPPGMDDSVNAPSLPGEGEGKMFGVLLCETRHGEPHVLRAFSGRLLGEWELEGFVPPIPSLASDGTLERDTGSRFREIERELGSLGLPWMEEAYLGVRQLQVAEWETLQQELRGRKAERDGTRSDGASLGAQDRAALEAVLVEQSRADDRIRKSLRVRHRSEVAGVKDPLVVARNAREVLLEERRSLSRKWTTAVLESYVLRNFEGETSNLAGVIGDEEGIRSGTGECCAPRLLLAAANAGLRPRAIAEIWIGSSTPDGRRKEGVFYPACEDKCVPMMGFMLCGGST